MKKIRRFLKIAFTPITIMVIPHCNTKPVRVKLPSIGFFTSVITLTLGSIYVLTMGVDTIEYKRMKSQLYYYSDQYVELKSTITALKKAELEFKKLFSLKTKEEVFKNLDTSNSGSIDMEDLKRQIRITMETVGEIREYLSNQNDIYKATPRGWPTAGHITSGYGRREHPTSGESEFHSGVDIATSAGTPVRATADGIVSFAAWSGGSGNLVVIEHGLKFSTFYGHNKTVGVKVGQKVKRGDIISYVGSTGNSTGPHVHYEVWHQGHPINPVSYIEGNS